MTEPTKAIITMEVVPSESDDGLNCTYQLEVPDGVDGTVPESEQPPVVKVALATMRWLARGGDVGESRVDEVSVVDKDTGERRVLHEREPDDAPSDEPGEEPDDDDAEAASEAFERFIRRQHEPEDDDSELVQAMKLFGRRKIAVGEGMAEAAGVEGYPFAVATADSGDLALLASDLDLDLEEVREVALGTVAVTVQLIVAAVGIRQFPQIAAGQWIDGLFTGLFLARARAEADDGR